MEAKGKLTKEVVAQEARFILDHLASASQYAAEVQVEELRRLCEQSISLRMADYVNFLERFGYLTYDRATHRVRITGDGERVVAGEKMAELVIDVVHHFRPILSRSRAKDDVARGARRGAGHAHVSSPQAQAPSGGVGVSSSRGGRERIDGRYEKLKAVGSGGIGTVYLARQVFLDRDVALKEVKELFGFFTEPQRQEMSRRFATEVRNAAGLSHPNIVAVIDGNTSREHPYVVTEFVTGGSLRRILSLAEKIPPELSVKIFLQILHGLGHAHAHGVLHRSLKPENILFDDAGNVRITDFGMARIVERDQAVIKHVYVGMGSVAYMAPELFSDPTNVGVQTDLYALGILLYEMLARKLPGRRSPMPTKLHPSLPKIIDDVFDKLTQDEQEDRYKSVDEVLEDFYKSDSAKSFMEPRGATYFTESPIDDLDLKPEEKPPSEAAATPEVSPPVVEASSASGKPRPTVETETGGDSVEGPAPEAAVAEVPAEHLAAGEATGVERIELAEDEPVAVEEIVASDPVSPSDGGPEEEESEETEDDPSADGKRRRRRNRPYSFQQRMKERDK